MKCPNCKKDIDEKNLSLAYTNTGREAICPECGKLIIFTRRINNPARNRPKHMSKNERLRARSEQRKPESLTRSR